MPEWEYQRRNNYHRILSAQASRITDEILSGKFDAISLLKDSRDIHRTLFSGLVPRRSAYFAGGYRGSADGDLKNYSVTIGSNSLVGIPPAQVARAMKEFGATSETVVQNLDLLHRDVSVPQDEKLIQTVEFACRLVAEFFLIHPYANGNGHVGRLMLLALLARYGYWMKNFDVHPSPWIPSYALSIANYQKSMKGVGGNREDFQRYVLTRLIGKPPSAPPPANQPQS